MKEICIDLNEFSTKRQRVFRFLVFGLLICVSLILLSILFLSLLSKTIEYLVVVIIIYLILYFYFVWLSFKTKLFIRSDEGCIIFKFGIRNSSKDIIRWNTIRKVRIGPTYIAFYKKSGRRRRYMLGWLPYAKVIEIKDSLITLLERLGVDYEVVDFIRYQNKRVR